MPIPLEESSGKVVERDVKLYLQDANLIRQLVTEINHPLDLLRELISNAASREVNAKNIWIRCYSDPEDIYVFEVEDDGVGMSYTGLLGRLDRFLSFGFISAVGEKNDEFGWKGLGSKLAFYSRGLEVRTYTGTGPVREVKVNAPWETISGGKKPKPKMYESLAGANDKPGTKIVVRGHPPGIRNEYTFAQIKDYLLHRTFVGFTRDRENPPQIHLTVNNEKEILEIGFPVLKKLSGESGPATCFVNISDKTGGLVSGKNIQLDVMLKGLYSVEASDFGLAEQSGNTGLILSVMGIPYFDLGLENYTDGRRGLGLNPSSKNCCLIVECDQIQEWMNMNRSQIKYGVEREIFDRAVKKLLRRVVESEDYKKFVVYTKRKKEIKGVETLDERRQKLERPEQKWVYWTDSAEKNHRIHREPKNEHDTLAVLWKLEALGALPFHQFETLEHGGRGADIIAHFSENSGSNPERFVTISAEAGFKNYKAHGNNPSQIPIVVCWNISKGRHVKLKDTDVSWKFVADVGDIGVRVFTLSKMPGVVVSQNIKKQEQKEAAVLV